MLNPLCSNPCRVVFAPCSWHALSICLLRSLWVKRILVQQHRARRRNVRRIRGSCRTRESCSSATTATTTTTTTTTAMTARASALALFVTFYFTGNQIKVWSSSNTYHEISGNQASKRVYSANVVRRAIICNGWNSRYLWLPQRLRVSFSFRGPWFVIHLFFYSSIKCLIYWVLL